MSAHPLTRPASWALTVGAPEMPLIRWAGGALWLAGALMGMVWLLALTEDVLARHASVGYLLLAYPAVLTWLVLAWRIWRRWSFNQMALTLDWLGPVSAGHGNEPPQGGFQVGEWRKPVRVRIALSWQGWLLLSLVRVRDKRRATPTYAWLDAREVEAPEGPDCTVRNRSLHQLRTLLHLPSSMTTLEGDSNASALPNGSTVGPSMASWPHSFNPGTTLRRLASLFRTERRSSSLASSRQDTAFPVTTVMAERGAARATVRVRGGGPR
jgi:hypothetical protein